MRKILIFSSLVIFTLSCEIGIVDINGLEETELAFDELPEPVKKVFLGESELLEDENWLLIPINENSRYELITKTTGPFTDFHIIKDNTDNHKFKIPYGNSFPFVIFNDELFIAQDYNVPFMQKARTVDYKKYKLI